MLNDIKLTQSKLGNNDISDIYKLRNWINMDKINWHSLSYNPNAIHLLEQNMDKINWYSLSRNPNAIHLLEQNIDKICWYSLSYNPNAIHLLEQNIDKINWYNLSANPNAIHLLEQNIDKIAFYNLSVNPNIFTYDYNKMKQNRINSGMAEELIAIVFHPDRLLRICEKYKIQFDELMEIY